MTIRHLRIFIEVAKSGKMSLAANHFFISQPTVSQTISELERYYNVLLFERISKRLYITDAGRVLLSHATKIVNDFENLEHIMQSTAHEQPIRIGATITIGACILSPMVTKLREIHPNIKLSISVSNTKQIEQKLLNSELDIALVEGKIQNFDINTFPIINDYMAIICSSKHRLAQKREVSLEDLKNEGFLLREDGSSTRELFLNFMQIRKQPINIIWESNNPEAIKQAVLDNQGLAVMSIRLFEEELRNNQVQILKIDGCSLQRKFSLVYHKNKLISQQINSFISIAQGYKNPPALAKFSAKPW